MSSIILFVPSLYLSIDGKLWVHQCVCLESSLRMIWNVIWYLWRRMVKYIVVLVSSSHIVESINNPNFKEDKHWPYLISHYVESLYLWTQSSQKLLIKCWQPLMGLSPTMSPLSIRFSNNSYILIPTFLEPWNEIKVNFGQNESKVDFKWYLDGMGSKRGYL